jgi:preprotein translocase subunit Sec63
MSDADFKKFVDSHRNISGIGYIEVPGKKLGRQIDNPSNTKTLPSIKSVRKLLLVLAVIGVFIVVYYIISRLVYFLREYSHKKKPPKISNPDERQFEENQNPEKRYLSVFGLQGTVSESEIKRICRELMSRYHPDKVQHLGREFQQMAEEKTKEIQEAYDYVKRKYNINN